MKNISLLLLVVILAPIFAFGAVSTNFTSSQRSGCIGIGGSPLFVQFNDNSTGLTGTHSYVYNWFFIKDTTADGTHYSTTTDTLYTATSDTVNVAFFVAAHYTVVEQVIDMTSHTTTSKLDSNYLIVHSPLSLNLAAHTSDTIAGCPGDAVTFFNTTDTFPYTQFYFNWRVLGASDSVFAVKVPTNKTPSFTFSIPGTYSILLTLDSSSSENCLSVFYKPDAITIVSLPYIDTSSTTPFSVSPGTACTTPATCNFAPSITNAGSYLWKFGDGTTSSANNPAHIFAHSGYYSDTLIAFSTIGSCPVKYFRDSDVHVGNRSFGIIVTNPALGDTTNVYCSGSAILAIDTTADSPSTYVWKWDGQNTDIPLGNKARFNDATAGTSYIMPAGTHTLTATINAGSGCVSTVSHTVNILRLPNPQLLTGPYFQCNVPDTITIIAQNKDSAGYAGATTFYWSFGDTTGAMDTTTSDTITHIYNILPMGLLGGPGGYNISVTITDTNGCVGTFATASPEVYLGQPPLLVSPLIDSGCTPFTFGCQPSIDRVDGIHVPFTIDSIAFWDTLTHAYTGDTTVIMPAINANDSIYATLSHPTYTGAAVFYYHLDSCGNCGGAGYTDTVWLHLGGAKLSLDSILAFSDSVCPMTPINFYCGLTPTDTDGSVPNAYWEWKFNTGPFHNVWDTTVSFYTTGKKIITVISSLNGCTDTLHDTIFVRNPATPSVSISQSDSCSASTLFKFTASGGGGPVSYFWNFGDGFTATSSASSPTVSHLYATDTVFFVTLMDSALNVYGCKNIDTLSLPVYPFNTYSSTMYLPDSQVCVGKMVTIYGPQQHNGDSVTATNYVQYYWTWGDGATSTISANNTATHTYTVTGDWAPKVLIKTKYGCYDSVSLTTATADTAAPPHYVHVGGPSGGFTAYPAAGQAPFTDSLVDNSIDSFSIVKRRWVFNPTPRFAAMPTIDTIFSGATNYFVVDSIKEGQLPDGRYTVVLYDTDAVGCGVKYTDTIRSQKVHPYISAYVLVDSVLLSTISSTVNVTGIVPGCKGLAYHFVDTNTNCSYRWNFGDGGTDSVRTPTHIYTDTGNYVVSLSITTLPGGFLVPGLTAADTFIDTIHIRNMQVKDSVEFETHNVSCPPVFVQAYNITPTPATYTNTYEWYITPIPGAVQKTTANLPLYTFVWTSGDTSQVRLIVINPLGCTDTTIADTTSTVTIGGPRGYIKISDSVGCFPLNSDTLTFICTNGATAGSITNITWYTGDGGPIMRGGGDTSVLVHSYGTDTGHFHPYILIDSAGACHNVYIPGPPTDTAFNHFYTVDVYKLVANISPTTRICFGSSTMIDASGADSTGGYQWSPNYGLSCDTCSSPVVNPRATTTYTVIVTKGLCMDTLNTTVNVGDSLYVKIKSTVANDSICQYATDTLIGNASIGSLAWTSSPDSNALSCLTCDTPVLSPTSSTMVYVNLTDSGCSVTDSLFITMKQLPVMNSATYGNVCNNLPIVYTPGSADTLASFVWMRAAVAGISDSSSAGTGVIAETLTDTLADSVIVPYWITVTALGCSTYDTVKYTVYPTPKMLTTSDIVQCSGALFTFHDTSATPGTTYTWVRDSTVGAVPITASGVGNISDAVSNSADSILEVKYYISLTANGCFNADTVTYSIYPVPRLTSSPNPPAICNHDSLNYIPTSNVPVATFRWKRPLTPGLTKVSDTGSGKIVELLNDTTHHTVDVVYVYTVTANGCFSTGDTVRTSVRPSFNLTSGQNFNLCSGNLFSYMPTVSSTDTTIQYAWVRQDVAGISSTDGGRGLDSIAGVVTNTSGQPEVLKYVYTISDSAGNKSCALVDTVRVDVVYPATAADISSAFVIPGNICRFTRNQNFQASTAPAANTVFNWSTSHGKALITGIGNTTQYALVSFETPGVDSIKLTAGSTGIGCNVYSKSFAVTIDTAVADTSTRIIYFGNSLYCLNNNEQAYQWGYDVPGSLQGVSISGETYQSYYIPNLDTAHYFYWVETWNNNSCAQKYYFNEKALGTNVVVEQENSFSIYPNPAGDYLTVVLTGAKNNNEITYAVVNLLGQRLITVNAVSGEATIDVSTLAAGSYIVESFIGGVKDQSKLFIKK